MPWLGQAEGLKNLGGSGVKCTSRRAPVLVASFIPRSCQWPPMPSNARQCPTNALENGLPMPFQCPPMPSQCPPNALPMPPLPSGGPPVRPSVRPPARPPTHAPTRPATHGGERILCADECPPSALPERCQCPLCRPVDRPRAQGGGSHGPARLCARCGRPRLAGLATELGQQCEAGVALKGERLPK